MLDAAIKTQLQTYLDKIIQSVEIIASLDHSEKSQEMRSMLQEIAALSPRLSFEERNEDAQRKPSFALNRVANRAYVLLAYRWAMSSRHWCWRSCTWVVILRKSVTMCSNRYVN